MTNQLDELDSRQRTITDGQELDRWKSTAATLFNPYLNVANVGQTTAEKTKRSQLLSSNKQFRTPNESLVGNNNPSNRNAKTVDQSKRDLFSRQVPTPDASQDVSNYVQQMIHSQFCGRSGTPSDQRYHLQNNVNRNAKDERQTKSTPTSRLNFLHRMSVVDPKQSSRVSDYALDHFFSRTDEQISRMSSFIPGRETSLSQQRFFSPLSLNSTTNQSQPLTLADMCHLAPNIGDKMSQTKEKVGLEAIRGFRLPSARLNYEPYEHQSMDAQLVLGQATNSETIRLRDVLVDDNYSNEQIIELIDDEQENHKKTRKAQRTVSSQGQIVQLKDWRGQISNANLPDVRIHYNRENSGRMISPQRPCTAASYLSKSRPTSMSTRLGAKTNEERGDPLPNNDFPVKERRPIKVRIGPVDLNRSDSSQEIIDPPPLTLTSETNDDLAKQTEIHQHFTTPDRTKSKTSSDSKYLSELDQVEKKPSYKYVSGSSRQIYKTDEQVDCRTDEQGETINQLTISQLQLLEQYDPVISAKIGVPFLPIQILSRPRQAQRSTYRTVEQIHRDYPKKNGQPTFEPRKSRSAQGIIEVAKTLQETRSRRVHLERQTTFERPSNAAPIEETIVIRSYESPDRYSIVLYSPSNCDSLVKHLNSTRTSSKARMSQTRPESSLIDNEQPSNKNTNEKNDGLIFHRESNRCLCSTRLFSLRMFLFDRQEDKSRSDRFYRNRALYRTSIVTNVDQHNATSNKPTEAQRTSVVEKFFLTEKTENDESFDRQSLHRQQIRQKFHVDLNLYGKFDLRQREKRENQQRAAIRIQRAYRQHLTRKRRIERTGSRKSASEFSWKEDFVEHRRSLSAKRARFVEEQLDREKRIHMENAQLAQHIEQTGASVEIFRNFNATDEQHSKKTLNQAALCIQRHWKGFIIRKRFESLKDDVKRAGFVWSKFVSRLRQTTQRIRLMRSSAEEKFHFDVEQARDFLRREKKMSTIFDSLSFNNQLDVDEMKHFIDCFDLALTDEQIERAIIHVEHHHGQREKDGFSRDFSFDLIHLLDPPLSTKLNRLKGSSFDL